MATATILWTTTSTGPSSHGTCAFSFQFQHQQKQKQYQRASASASVPVPSARTDGTLYYGLPTTPLRASTADVDETDNETDTDTNSNSNSNSIDILDEVDSIFDCIDTNGDGVITLEELQSHLVDRMGYSVYYTTYLFDSIDTDSNGSISKDELRFAFYNFEAVSMYLTFAMGGSSLTSNHKSKLRVQELVRNREYDPDPDARDTLLLRDLADLVFDIVDTDGSGEISKEELRDHFETIAEQLSGAKNNNKDGGEDNAPEPAPTDTQARDYVQTMFATLDADRDGGISREEVRSAFEKYDVKLLARTFGLKVYQSA
eukprot:jgi/Psemu1/41009/gm1.41009_g